MAAVTANPRPHWIGGSAVPSNGRDVIEVVNPADGTIVAAVPAGTQNDVDHAVAQALSALAPWSATSVEERIAVVTAIAAGITARADELAAIVTAEMGTPVSVCKVMQVDLPAVFMSSFSQVAAEFAWEEQIANSTVIKEPVGVVGAIAPWNFPLHQIVAKVAPALLAGNTVVVKPSEVAPSVGGILAEIAATAGLPPGVLNVVHGGAAVGQAIATHPGVDMVSFTGSTKVGRLVAAAAADPIKRLALELGGKSASIILPSADLDAAVPQALGGAWNNAGQTCAAWTRMLVPANQHDEIVERLIAAAAIFTVGAPTERKTMIGPLASALQRERVTSYIRRGIADGAVLAMGGPEPVPGLEHGAYVAPTVFANVDPESVIAQEEIFGPVLSVIPYADDEDAVTIANNSDFGLSGAVFGDEDRAVAVARRLRTGQVDINGLKFNLLAPFGGFKQSGNGSRELGRCGLEEFVEIKSIQR